MDLTAFKLQRSTQHAVLRFANGTEAELDGAAVRFALEAAGPLIDYIERARGGRVRSLSVNYMQSVLRATLEDADGQVNIVSFEGDTVSAEILPRADELATRLVSCIHG